MHKMKVDVKRQPVKQGRKASSLASPSSVLGETNHGRLLTEALTAEVKTVFANETSLMSTQTTLPRTFAVFPGAREPNGIVGHFVLNEKRPVLKRVGGKIGRASCRERVSQLV